ncbi:MAG: ABC transporter permease [Clostridia bacterium]|nr:ABC transporter permease [Clostridia bacterium]
MKLSLSGTVNHFTKYRDFFVLLVERDIKLKYRRSFLGYLWSILSPLLSMVVLTVVFSTMFHRSIENFPVYLLIGNIMFSFMRESSTLAMYSILNNAALLKKVRVPKYIFTLSTVTSSFVTFVFSLGALIIVMLATSTQFSLYLLLIFIPIVELYVFSVGLGLLVAQATVFFRDVKNIWGVVTLAWMYLTPIFYPLEAVPDFLQKWIPILNPMYSFITQARTLVLDRMMPEPMLILQGALMALVMLLLGSALFKHNSKSFILYI